MSEDLEYVVNDLGGDQRFQEGFRTHVEQCTSSPVQVNRLSVPRFACRFAHISGTTLYSACTG